MKHLSFFSLSGLAPEKIGELKHAFAKSGYKGFRQRRIEQLKSQKEVPSALIARSYARLGDKEKAFEWLEKAYTERNDLVLRLKEDPSYDILRSDQRYADLLRRIGLPH